MLFATASDLLANSFAHCRRLTRAALLFSFSISLFTLAVAQDSPVRVARISLIEGEVSYQRTGDGQNWYDASLNLPLNERDQLYSGPGGRSEIQITGRNLIRIDRNTNLRFSQFNNGTIQFALPVGTATFRVDSLDRRQFSVVDASDLNNNDPVYFEVDTPIAAVTFLKEGNYRINVREDGTTEVIVRHGQAEVYNREIGAVTVKQGRRIVVDGRDANYFQIARLEDKDNWDRWNDRRDDDLLSRAESSRSARYVPVAVPGVYDLDSYGEWYETPDYGWVWYPRSVAVGWVPYRVGYWRYYSGWGWTWVSYEPWGWVPYHYGRWAWYRSRWCWVPNVSVGWGWAPHQVVFFGWGGGYNQGYRDGYRDGRYGWYGWAPLGPRDRYYGGRGSTTAINPRSLDNYNAPGGVSVMESRKFDNGRVIVTQNDIKAPGEITLPPAPPRGAGAQEDRTIPAVLRGEEFKPTQAVPTRELKIERTEIARRLDAPVIERRPVSGLDRVGAPSRGGADRLPTRDAQPGNVTSDRSAPTRNTDASSASPSRIQDGQIVRPDRKPRESEYRTVDRTPAPTRSLPESERNTPSRDGVDAPRSTPNREVNRGTDRPARVETPRTYDPPSRSETPKRYDPPPSRPVERPSSPPPSRDSAPSRTERAPERPSSPPPSRDSSPPRESAPSKPAERAPERQSSPSRESPPSRPIKPNSQF
ncbi:MAG: FecR domain-containing protein [Acidobacteria bacterium]|nr:FecR domain-containing protein [Acidobacteriota bacterium]